MGSTLMLGSQADGIQTLLERGHLSAAQRNTATLLSDVRGWRLGGVTFRQGCWPCLSPHTVCRSTPQ